MLRAMYIYYKIKEDKIILDYKIRLSSMDTKDIKYILKHSEELDNVEMSPFNEKGIEDFLLDGDNFIYLITEDKKLFKKYKYMIPIIRREQAMLRNINTLIEIVWSWYKKHEIKKIKECLYEMDIKYDYENIYNKLWHTDDYTYEEVVSIVGGELIRPVLN